MSTEEGLCSRDLAFADSVDTMYLGSAGELGRLSSSLADDPANELWRLILSDCTLARLPVSPSSGVATSKPGLGCLALPTAGEGLEEIGGDGDWRPDVFSLWTAGESLSAAVASRRA